MELDDLKQSWKQGDKTPSNTPNIMELIHQKSKGPIASLKTAFRKQMGAITAIMASIIITQARNIDNASSNVLFWTYIGFCLAMIAAFYFNYRLTQKMESMDEQVKNNLEQHVALLEQRLKWQVIGTRLVGLLFVLLLEVLPLYQHGRMLDKWHALPAAIRFACYAAFFVLQYFLGRAIKQRKFGKHLDHLKSLLQELR
jgi:cyanate permease